MGRENFCLNFSALALKYEFHLIIATHISSLEFRFTESVEPFIARSSVFSCFALLALWVYTTHTHTHTPHTIFSWVLGESKK